MRILVTGGNGFIARNLLLRLRELGNTDVQVVTRETSPEEFRRSARMSDFVFHLAGVNRPADVSGFEVGNVGLTRALCEGLVEAARGIPVVFASSVQASLDNDYGRSKKAAEDILLRYAERAGARIYLFRLTNVFGKWARPFYNSAVATFCHQATRGLPLAIRDPAAPLRLVHVDDVVKHFVRLLDAGQPGGQQEVAPVYESTVGEVADCIQEFARSRASLAIPRVGAGLVRALYATYVSYLPKESFSYTTPLHSDSRGEFVEMLKTPDCGQMSYFTAPPGVTRGEHYHHSKTEKFLVVRGTARFAYRNLATDETYELEVRGGEGRIVETVPGWVHSIKNTGSSELVVMLWANEVFDRQHPDTYAAAVAK